MTALLDAVGRTIDELGERLANLPEKSRPRQVIVAILTDGIENASTRYSWKEILAKIKHQTEAYKWNFFFLGANQDAIATAAQTLSAFVIDKFRSELSEILARFPWLAVACLRRFFDVHKRTLAVRFYRQSGG